MNDFETEGYRWPRLHGLLYNRPLLIDSGKADELHVVLQGYAMGQPPALDVEAFRAEARRRPYRVTAGGVAIVPVTGSLTHRGGSLDAMSGLTSYRYLHAMLSEAEADAEVKGVLLELDTPGGSADGLFELVGRLRGLSQVKPLWGVINEQALSAGYAIASACDRLLAPATALAGSIGVIMMHLDRSAADAKAGRVYTPIYAGFHKADGSPHAPLSDAARDKYQGLVDNVYQVFTAQVAEGRGLALEDVVATQAQIYHAQQAIELGLVDQVVTGLDQALQLFEGALVSQAGGSDSVTRAAARTIPEGVTMSDDNQHDDGQLAVDQVDLDAARAEGVAEGQKAERDRVAGILALDAAAGRVDGQLAAMISRGLAVDDAAAILAEAKPVAGGDFVSAMQAVGNPDIEQGSGSPVELTDEARAARAVSFIQKNKG